MCVWVLINHSQPVCRSRSRIILDASHTHSVISLEERLISSTKENKGKQRKTKKNKEKQRKTKKEKTNYLHSNQTIRHANLYASSSAQSFTCINLNAGKQKNADDNVAHARNMHTHTVTTRC